MPSSRPEFDARLTRLKADLVAQARVVQRAIESAVDGAFERNASKGRRAIELDHQIDAEDVRIERSAVQLLADATAQGVRMDERDIRMILTIVKVNNELERVADAAVSIAERAEPLRGIGAVLPPKFRVMANSVIGIMQTTVIAFEQMDRVSAEVVLASDDATEAFKQAILQDTMQHLACGQHTVDFAMALGAVASNLGRIADHCTNVAEQVIYVATGMIVRHEGDKWTKPEAV